MKIKALYRLNSYRITEYESGVLWWETHFDFGKQRSGECFIQGNILIIQSWSEEKDGLLIGEFLDQLKKLPVWDKTPYYCFASELLDIKTGRKPTADRFAHLSSRINRQQLETEGLKDLIPGSYRIDRYRLSINEDGTIFWQTPRGMDRIISGPGLIESGILFLGPMVGGELKENKQEFLYHLSPLPQWTNTRVWCRHYALRACREKQPEKPFKKISTPPKKVIDSISRECPPIPLQEPLPKQPSPDFTFMKSWPSFSSRLIRFNWPRFSWAGFLRKKYWVAGLILFILSGLIVAGIVTFHALGEKLYRAPWYKNHHHEYHGEHHSKLGLLAILSIILFSFFSLPPITRDAVAEEKHIILEDSGILYPGGFDLNTVGEIQGKATHFSRPGKGPVRFQLITDRDREPYTVLTSPPWYWDEKQVKITEGAEVLVRGSKSFGKDGYLYIVAQEVRIPLTGQSFYFRGKDGKPLWKGHGESGRESPAGFGSSFDHRGGFGDRGGSRGHGRR